MKKDCLSLISLILLVAFSAGSYTSEIEEKEKAVREALFVASVSQPKVLKLTLVDCLGYALQNNPDIKIKRIEPLLSTQDIKIARAEFKPNLSFEGRLEDSKVESASALAGSHSRTGSFNFSIDGKLPLGTEYNIDFLNKRHKENSVYLNVNPYYQTETVLTMTQPLFKDFGIFVNRADIVIANNDLEKSNQNLTQELIEVISQVKQSYYSYVLSIEKYKTAQISLQRAEDLLQIVEKRHEQGMVSSIDILEAKTGAAEREDLLLSVEKAMKGAQDNLKFVTSLINDLELWHAQIEPMDRPEIAQESAGLVESLEQAFEFRPDYQAAKIELKNQDIRIKFKKNALLPTVDLEASIGINGLDQDYEQALKADYKSWGSAVKVNLPWGRQEAKASYEKASLLKEQLLISFDKLQQQIILEVREAVRLVNNAQKKIITAKKRVDTESARYQAIEQRFREGLVNAHDMLEYQEDLSSAETSYIQALIDYAQAKIGMEETIGITLVKNDIKLEEQ